MAKFRQFQTNFSSGLLSDGMGGRVDLQAYTNGCQQLLNWWPIISGGQRRRPGSFSLGKPTQQADGRTEPFIFNEDQTYVILFTPGWYEVFSIASGSFVATGSAPWTADHIRELSITQRGDVMLIAHQAFQTRKLVRTGATTFSLDFYEFEKSNSANTYPWRMPFYKFADTEVTLDPTSHTGSVTFIASANVFDASFVGRVLRYRGKQFVVTSYVNPTTIVGDVKETLDRSVRLEFSAGDPEDYIIGEIVIGRTTGFKAQVIRKDDEHISVAQVAGNIGSGSIEEKVEGLDSGNICTVSYRQTRPPIEDTDWDEQAFSDARGWPGEVEFHSQRLWLGGSSSLPAHVFGSKVAAFFNFDVGDGFPDESIQAIISDNQVQRINAFVSGQHFQIFTDAGEFYAPQSDSKPLSPETFSLKKPSRYGSNPKIEPALLDEGTIFVQNDGNAVREFLWSDQRQSYVAEPISLLNEELTTNIRELDVLYGGYDRPEQLALFVKEDGDVVWYHTARAEQIRAWGLWSTNGKWLSLSIVGDKIYALVERSINGVTTYFLERMELDLTVDGAIEATNGTAQKSWNAVAPNYANETVSVVVDDPTLENAYYLGDFTLDGSGSLELNYAVDNVRIGFNYTQTLEPMPVEVQLADGLTTGKPKRIVCCDVLMRSTLALKVGGQKLSTYQTNSNLSQPPLYSKGMKKFYLLGVSDRPTVTLTNDIPVPCEILAMSMEVEF